jgi:hypothetical protein
LKQSIRAPPESRINDKEALRIDVPRADEESWMQLVIGNNAYTACLNKILIVPSAEYIRKTFAKKQVKVEVGASLLTKLFAKSGEPWIYFYTIGVTNLRCAFAAEIDKRRSRDEESTGVAGGIEDHLNSQPRITLAPVSAASLLSPDFKEDNEMDVLPVRNYDNDASIATAVDVNYFEHPLNDYRRFVNVSQLTLYEINCYSEQRLAVLLTAYRAYNVADTRAERKKYVEILIQSHYPVFSGAVNRLIHAIKGAPERQLMHEGIGLAMLCFCAKHDVALRDNLLLIEMCYQHHRRVQKAKEFCTSFDQYDNDDDDDDGGDDIDSNNKQVQEHNNEYARLILTYIDGCTDVLALDANQFLPDDNGDQKTQSYNEFFAILHDLSNTWKTALVEIEENRKYANQNIYDDTDNGVDDDESASSKSVEAAAAAVVNGVSDD